MKLKWIVCGLALSMAVSCAKKPEETDLSSIIPTDGSQNAATLAGDGVYCEVHTDLGGTYSMTHDLVINAAGTYTYTLFFSNGSTCTTGTNASGTNYATYNQSGTFTLNGFGNISGVGTKISFKPISQSMIIQAGAGLGQTQAQALATWLNSCSNAPSFSTSATSTRSLNGNICASSGSFAAQDLPVNGATNYQNVIYRNGTILQMGQPSAFVAWGPFGVSTPVSFSKTFLLW